MCEDEGEVWPLQGECEWKTGRREGVGHVCFGKHTQIQVLCGLKLIQFGVIIKKKAFKCVC
jgi:hypothetical protein